MAGDAYLIDMECFLDVKKNLTAFPLIRFLNRK
jgi:hypothetical protein